MKGIQTEIKNVRIYRNGAIIRRQGKAELERGDNQLLIAGATKTADFNTVRLYFPAGTRMSDLRFTYPQDEEKESAAVQEEIEELESRSRHTNCRSSSGKKTAFSPAVTILIHSRSKTTSENCRSV